MRRLARRLFTLCSAVSLVLCVAACVLWARSYTVLAGVFRESFSDETPGAWSVRKLGASSMYGGLELGFDRLTVTQPADRVEGLRREYRGVHWRTATNRPRRKPPDWWKGHVPAVRFSPVARRPGFATWQAVVNVPYWCACPLLALLPAWRLRAALRARANSRQGRCPSCGYDLRASPERCPECGAAAVKEGNP